MITFKTADGGHFGCRGESIDFIDSYGEDLCKLTLDDGTARVVVGEYHLVALAVADDCGDTLCGVVDDDDDEQDTDQP